MNGRGDERPELRTEKKKKKLPKRSGDKAIRRWALGAAWAGCLSIFCSAVYDLRSEHDNFMGPRILHP